MRALLTKTLAEAESLQARNIEREKELQRLQLELTGRGEEIADLTASEVEKLERSMS